MPTRSRHPRPVAPDLPRSPRPILATALCLVLVMGGCAAAKASIHIVAADGAIHKAEAREASERATYEYTMASRYLEKAREEFGEADFRVAETLSKAAAKWADQAIIVMEQRGPEVDTSLLTERPSESSPPDAPGTSEPAPPAQLDPLFEPSTTDPYAPAPGTSSETEEEPPLPEEEEEEEEESNEFDDALNEDEDEFDWEDQ